MTEEQFYQTRQAIEMLMAAYSDVEQTITNFAEADFDLVESHWEPATKMPPADKKVIVITNDGCMYFQTAINGKLMPNVKWWMSIPTVPES